MHHDINCSMWNKFLIKPSLLKSSCYLRSGFQRPMCDASKFFLVLGSFGAVEMTAHIKQWLMLSRWLWTFSWIMMFIPSNFYITFGFTNVTWTTRTIPFIDNIMTYNRFYLLKEIKIMFVAFHVITTLKLLLVNL